MYISDLRESLGMTIEEFAVEVGASARTVSYWESRDKQINDNGILRPFKSAMAKLARKVKQ